MDTAFCRAVLVTLVGSMIPHAIKSSKVLFEALNPKDGKAILDAIVPVNSKKGDVIIKQGDEVRRPGNKHGHDQDQYPGSLSPTGWRSLPVDKMPSSNGQVPQQQQWSYLPPSYAYRVPKPGLVFAGQDQDADSFQPIFKLHL